MSSAGASNGVSLMGALRGVAFVAPCVVGVDPAAARLDLVRAVGHTQGVGASLLGVAMWRGRSRWTRLLRALVAAVAIAGMTPGSMELFETLAHLVSDGQHGDAHAGHGTCADDCGNADCTPLHQLVDRGRSKSTWRELTDKTRVGASLRAARFGGGEAVYLRDSGSRRCRAPS